MPSPTSRDVHIERPLSNVSIAYKNESYLYPFVMPTIKVQSKTDHYWKFPKQSWFINSVGTRAPGTRAPRADYDLTSASYVCINRSLAKAVPDEVRLNADSPLRPDIEAAEFVTDQLMKDSEIRVANMTTGGSALWASASTPSTAWTSDTSNPYDDIDDSISAVILAIGRMPNVMVTSWDVWRNLRNHPDLLARVQYTRPGSRITAQDMKDWFGVEKFLVGTSVYDPAQEGAAASNAYIWGDSMWIGYVTPTPSLMTPSAGYVFEWRNRTVRRFREQQEYTDVIEVSHDIDEVITACDAGAVLYSVI